MASSFQTVKVLDDRLNCKSALKYGVDIGAAQITVSESPAQSQTTSSHVYNIIVPSETVIIDRRIEWSSTVVVYLNYPNLDTAGNVTPYDLLDYGNNSALCAYPLHSTTTTMSATINSNTVTLNSDDVLPLLMRFMDKQHIEKYTGTTPTALDTYYSYADQVGASNSPFGAYNNTEKSNDYHGRGSHPVKIEISTDGGVTWANGSMFNGAANNATTKIRITFKVTEPLMVSPFIYAHESVNSQGIYGVSNMNFRFNINPNANLININPNYQPKQGNANVVICLPSITINSFTDSKLTLVYLSPKPSMLLPYRNCVTFYDIPRYITSGSQTIASGATGQQTIQQMQLNQVPDKIAFAVRFKRTNCGKSDSRMKIEKISINFDNSAGLLSSANAEKLWLMSVEAGCNQSWLQYSGEAYVYGNGSNGNKPLTSGFLVLDMAKHVQLTPDFYAPGSLGQFNFSAQLTFKNQTGATVNPDDYEIITYVMNSGIWVTERSTCSSYTGILNKSDVLNTLEQKTYYHSDVQRIVGAGFTDNLKSSIGSAMAESAKEGEGMTGGGSTGGGSTGGTKHRTR